jgi:L-lactate dehydrogenase complex protein LldG
VTSREEVLAALRRGAPAAEPLDVHPWRPVPAPVRFPEPAVRLAEAVEAVGGGFLRAETADALARAVAELRARLEARRVVCEVPEAGPGSERLSELGDPHRLAGVDLAILPGAFAVAENGAVWLPTAGLRHRGVFVIAEHLALVVRAEAIVNDMHEAYARLRFEGSGFGVFIAGPSKTADIEQALVIGAHGPRSCTVFLLG